MASVNWFNALMMVPQIVLGVEGLVQEAKSGATKKQLAMDSLMVANATADSIAPQYAPASDLAAAAVSSSIDMWTKVFNQLGVFKKTTSVVPTTPATTGGTPAVTGGN